LELINLYVKILRNKHEEVEAKMSRLENGLEKLRTTAAQVDELTKPPNCYLVKDKKQNTNFRVAR